MSTLVKADATGAVTLPAELCRAAGVEPGADLVAEVQDGRIVLERQRRPIWERIAALTAEIPRRRARQIAARRCRRRSTITCTATRNDRSNAPMPPRILFADTFYWVALLNPRDAFHAARYVVQPRSRHGPAWSRRMKC